MSSIPLLHWCFSTLGCPAFTFDEAAALAKRYGIERLELRVLENRMDLPAYLKEKYGSPERFAEVVAASGVRVVALDTSFRVLGAKEKDWTELFEFLPWAEALGGCGLRVFDGGQRGAPVTVAMIEEAAVTWDRFRKERNAKGWKSVLLVETHDAFTRVPEILSLAGRTGALSNILWDTFHTWNLQGTEATDAWPLLRNVVPHIHVKDGFRAEGEKKSSYAPFGQGAMAIEPLLRMLAEENWQGTVSIEWERKWRPELPPLEECLESAKKMGWLPVR